MAVVDARLLDELERLRASYELGDGSFAQRARYFHHGAYEVLVDFVLWQIADKAAVYLQVVDGEVLQFVERRKADAEIIERQVAADMPKRVSEDFGAIGVRDGSCFGDLEGQE